MMTSEAKQGFEAGSVLGWAAVVSAVFWKHHHQHFRPSGNFFSFRAKLKHLVTQWVERLHCILTTGCLGLIQCTLFGKEGGRGHLSLFISAYSKWFHCSCFNTSPKHPHHSQSFSWLLNCLLAQNHFEWQWLNHAWRRLQFVNTVRRVKLFNRGRTQIGQTLRL